MPNVDFIAITEYFEGESTHAAIRAGLYLSTLPETQRDEIASLFS